VRIIGIAMVRDEADIIGFTLDHLHSQGVDRVIVADNRSDDGTVHKLYEFGERHQDWPLRVIHDPELGYYQDRKMSALARQAHEEGADWIVPFDADELWYSPDGLTIREALAEVPDDVPVVSALEFKHWPTPWDMPGDPNPYTRMVWRESTAHRLVKVAFRAHPDPHLHMGNHGINLGPYNPDQPDTPHPLLELRHFPYRSFEQFVRKVRNGRQAYEAATVCDTTTVAGHRMTGTHWKEMGALTDDQLAELWSDAVSGFACSADWLAHGDLIKDPAPWG
jgi:glycosyltransferase involved in cell wall biosynthesis